MFTGVWLSSPPECRRRAIVPHRGQHRKFVPLCPHFEDMLCLTADLRNRPRHPLMV